MTVEWCVFLILYSLLLNQTVLCSVCMRSFTSNSESKRFPAETSNLYDFTTQYFNILCIKHFLFIIFCSFWFDELFAHFINKKMPIFGWMNNKYLNIDTTKFTKIYAKNNFWHIQHSNVSYPFYKQYILLALYCWKICGNWTVNRIEAIILELLLTCIRCENKL